MADTLDEFWQLAQRNLDPLFETERTRDEVAPVRAGLVDVARHGSSGGYRYVVGRRDVVLEADFPGKSVSRSDAGAAADSRLSRDHGILANEYVVCDLYEIVDFHPIANVCASSCCSIDRSQRADFAVFADPNAAHLWDLSMPLAIPKVPETVGPEDGPGMHRRPIAHGDVSIERDLRINAAAFTDNAVGADVAKRIDSRPAHHAGTVLDNAIRTDPGVGIDFRALRDQGSGMNAFVEGEFAPSDR
jgi:hypothetical protein